MFKKTEYVGLGIMFKTNKQNNKAKNPKPTNQSKPKPIQKYPNNNG